MADENNTFSNEEPTIVNPPAMPPANAEESPTAVTPPTETGAPDTLADEPTRLMPGENSTQETSAAEVVADEPTQMITPATLADSSQETANAQTVLMAPAGLSNAAEQAEPVAQAHEQAGEAFPVEIAAPGAGSASGALFAEQNPAGYPPTAAYEPNYAQTGYPATAAYGQPGYPQDMYQQPYMPLQPGQTGLLVPPRKRRTGLWIVLIVVIVLLLGSGTALAVVLNQRTTNTPTQALQQFCDGYKALDAQKVYDTLSDASKSSTSLTQLQQSFDELKGLSSFAKISACTVSNVQQKDSTATGTITLTITVSFGSISSTSASPMPMQLVLENHTWKVDATKMSTPSTIPTFPPDFLTPTVQGSNQ